MLSVYAMEVERFSRLPLHSDFSKFYASAKLFDAGEDVYAEVPLDLFETDRSHIAADTLSLHPNLNTPPFILLTSPLAWFEYRDAFRLFSLFSIVLAALGVAVLERATGGAKGTIRLLLLLFLFFAYFPSLVCVIGGQVSFVLFFLVMVCWIGLRSGKEALSGLALGLLISLKLFTGMLLVYFIALRRWKSLAWCAASAVCCNGAAAYTMGWEAYVNYVKVLGSTTWYSASWNASFTGFLTRILGGSENTPLVNLPLLAFGLSLALSLLLTGILVRLAAEQASKPGRSPDATFSFAVVVMLLASPYGWMYYFPLLFLPLVVCWQAASSLGRPVYRATATAAWVLSTVPHELIPSSLNNIPLKWVTWQGAYFYALLLFGGILVKIIVQTGKKEPHRRAKDID